MVPQNGQSLIAMGNMEANFIDIERGRKGIHSRRCFDKGSENDVPNCVVKTMTL